MKQKKMMMRLFAKFLVAFFAALGIKIKAKRARRAVEVAEKFFNKISKMQSRRSKKFGKANRTKMLRKFRPMFQGLTWQSRSKVKRMLRTSKQYRRLCRKAIKTNNRKEIWQLVMCATRRPGQKMNKGRLSEAMWTSHGLVPPPRAKSAAAPMADAA